MDENINSGKQRFLKHLSALKSIIKDAAKSDKPELEVYHSDARKYAFYLQALAKLYKGFYPKKRFKKMQANFKGLEDQIGRIDFYDVYIKEFSEQKHFPDKLLKHLKEKYDAELINLRNILSVKGWLDGAMKDELIAKLDKTEWLPDTEETAQIRQRLVAEIAKTTNAYDSGELNFNDIELGVHEFRRNIRWFSIYAQALDGLIQLGEGKPDASLEVYQTKEVLESPFNQLPKPKEDLSPIVIDKNIFYALSWMVKTSGDLKDEGLRIYCIEEAMKATEYADDTEIPNLAKELALGSKKSVEEIKTSMGILANQFLNQAKVLKKLSKNIATE